MEDLQVRLPDGRLRENVAEHATALKNLTERRYAEEQSLLAKMASLNAGEAGRRALNWLRRSDDEFAAIVERSSGASLSTTAKRELVALKNGSAGAIALLLAEQLRLEEQLAVLVEDLYGLDDQERKLLRATRPVRDPLDVLKGSLGATGGLAYPEAEEARSER